MLAMFSKHACIVRFSSYKSTMELNTYQGCSRNSGGRLKNMHGVRHAMAARRSQHKPHIAAFIWWALLQYSWSSAYSADTRLAKGHIRGQERVAVFDNFLSPLSTVAVLPGNTSRISNSVDINNPYVATVFSSRAKAVSPRLADAPSLGNVVADFDLKVSMRAARLESISYCVNNDEIMRWNCTRCTAVAGVTPYAIIYDDIWDVMAIVAYDAELEAITVMFRGTDSSNLWNWFEDLRYWKTNYMMDLPDAAGAKIHTGFWLLWSSSILEQNVTDAFTDVRSKYPKAPVYIIGHSMGGTHAIAAGRPAFSSCPAVSSTLHDPARST
jgi:hypothetical protein